MTANTAPAPTTAATPPANAFVHLRLYSEYDVQKGIARIDGEDGIVQQAKQLQQPALALTDTGCVFGAIKFYERCRAAGIKPLIGCELKTDAENEHYLLLLCANADGYVNLNRMLSRLYTSGDCVPRESLTAADTAGLIALSGGARGDVGAAIARGQLDVAQKRARQWAQIFPERFYLEVWRASPQDNNAAAAASDIAWHLGLPLAATHPVQCTKPQDKDTLDVKLCIAAGQRIFDPQRPRPLSDAPHLLSAAEMQTRFADMPGALDNSAEIAKRCNFSFKLGETHLPSLPEKNTSGATNGNGEENNNGVINAAALLRQEAEAGLAKKLPQNMPPQQRQEYEKRLDYELGIIGQMKFEDYFLIVMDFIRWAKNNNIPVGPGRGSGAGSLAAYALDITTLDPLQYDLLFERFLNPERVSMPDFDIDFCVNGRDDVIRYVENHYGKDRVSQIVTFGTIGAKGALRDVGRVRGMPYGQCDRLARLIPETPKMTIERALKESSELAEERKAEDVNGLIETALQVEGLPRNIGTHAGGVLIAPRPMEEFCPRYAAADTNTLVSQFDMGDIEKIGLVKFDFLGLRTLTILAHAEKWIKESVDNNFSLETLPLDDAETYALYSQGNTSGVFQCESGGMRELMKKLKPDRFTDLIALVALYRPGPLNAGMDTSYIARKHGSEDVSYPHESLETVLDSTYGLFIYQEQVMEIARRISGYTLGEADILRRAMGKKDEEKMASMRMRFVDGSDGKMARTAAEKLFNDMAQFAEYGFNKSHAAAYALLSYRTAYVKTHYPAIMLAAVLSAEADSTKRVQILFKDAARQDIRITPPDINTSTANFYPQDEQTIRFGLKAIKGMGSGVIAHIVNARADKPFTSLFDFCKRTSGNVPAAALELLAAAGAFDSLHKNRAAVAATIPSALAQDFNSGDLFAADSTSDDSAQLATAAEWTLHEKLQKEQQAFGFPMSDSYYSLYKDILPQLPLSWPSLAALAAAGASDHVAVAGSFVKVVRRPQQGKDGVFILRDAETEIEVLAAAEHIKALRGENTQSQLLIIHGRAFNRYRGDVTIKANSIHFLPAFLQARLRRLTLHCENAACIKTLPPLLPQTNSGKQETSSAKQETSSGKQETSSGKQETSSSKQETSSSKQETSSGKQEIRLQYNDKTLQHSYAISLGTNFQIDYPTYQRLHQTKGIKKVQLKFA